MKKKVPAFLLLISLVFSGTGCFHDEAWASFWLWWFYAFGTAFHYHSPDCGSCDPACSTCSAHPSQWAATPESGPDASVYYGTAASDEGVFAAGSITGNRLYDFGTAGIVSAGFAGGTNALLVKYDTNGSADWTATMSTASDNSCLYAVSAGTDGIYAAGTIDGNESFRFENGVIVSGHYASGNNTLLVKYDGCGAPLWARSVTTGPDASSLYAVAAGNDGIYAAGCITGNRTYDFGNGVTATGTGSGSNAVIIKYDATGTPLWARTIAAGTGDSCYHAVTSQNGYIIAAGYISGCGEYEFGDSRTARGSYGSGPNALLVKYSADGTVHWAESVAGGTNGSAFYSVALAEGMVYAAGYVTGIGRYDFGNGTTVIGGGNGPNAAMVQYSMSGAAQWVRSVTSNPDNSCFISVSPGSDGIYAAGFINGSRPYNFGNAVTVSGTYAGGPNVVLVKYTAGGTTRWAKSVESGWLESCYQSVAASYYGLYAAGYVYGNNPYYFGDGLSADGPFSGINSLLVKY